MEAPLAILNIFFCLICIFYLLVVFFDEMVKIRKIYSGHAAWSTIGKLLILGYVIGIMALHIYDIGLSITLFPGDIKLSQHIPIPSYI